MQTEAAAEADRRAPKAHPLGGHLPVLDGVRGLAILMVLVLHFVAHDGSTGMVEKAIMTLAGWGQYGVDLFFVLSGFLITGILYDARNKPFFFRNFYMRRVLRIFPLYYGVLFVLFVVLPLVPACRGPALDTIVQHQAWAWLYGVNVYNAFKPTWALPYIDHFWSLAVEEHFYVVWPVVVFLLGKRPRALMNASLAVIGGALAARIACSVAGVGDHALYVATPFRLDGLAMGAFLAVLGRQPRGLAKIATALPHVAATTFALLLVRAVWAHTIGTGLTVLRPIRESLVTVMLACVLVWAVTAPSRSLWARFLTSRWMTFLGVYSYGLYVYHHFFSYYAETHDVRARLAGLTGSPGLGTLVLAVGGSAASLAVAYLSYELFEKRFLALKRRFESRREHVV